MGAHLVEAIDRYAVIGHPVEHSLSPRIHALFAKQTGQVLIYERLECPLDGFDAVLRQFAHDTSGHAHTRWRPKGCNITVPFKFAAYQCAAQHTPRAQLAQAANTLRLDGADPSAWLADNTDGIGLVRDIENNARIPLCGKRVLLIGAGGAAAGVLGPLLAAGPQALVVVNRTAEKALQLVQTHQNLAQEQQVELRQASLGQPGLGYDIIINASASSLGGQALPLPSGVFAAGSLAVDLMYGPPAQHFLGQAQALGAQGRDGLGMLVEQAAESFALWRDIRPETAPVLAEMRAYLVHKNA